jgi:very-short-patch-repair endonuclease
MTGGVRPRRKPTPTGPEDDLPEAVPLRFARKLRRSQTASEYKLWQALRRNQVSDAHFRRQHPIGPYVADFVCLQLKLIVEVDGPSHLTADQIVRDLRRTHFLNDKGYSVVRFWNLDVLTNLDRVVERIEMEVRRRFPPPTKLAGAERSEGGGPSASALPLAVEAERDFVA